MKIEIDQKGNEFFYQCVAETTTQRVATVPRKFNKETQEMIKNDWNALLNKLKTEKQ